MQHTFDKTKKFKRFYEMHNGTVIVIVIVIVIALFPYVMEMTETIHSTMQGVKLRQIQVPMRLNFSLWRPNPEI